MRYEKLSNVWINPTKAEVKDIGPATIAFDFDSTINEMGEPLGRYIAKHLECTEDEVRGFNSDGSRCFHFEAEGVSSDTISQLVHKYVLEEAPSLLPTPFAIEVLEYIHSKFFEPITVITYRPEEATIGTYRWLNENLPTTPFNLIMLNGMQKNVVLSRLGTEVFVDDRYKTAQILEKVINLSVLYKRPWNQGRLVEAGDVTITDLRGLIPFVNYMTRTDPMAWPGNIPYPDRIGRGKVVDLYA